MNPEGDSGPRGALLLAIDEAEYAGVFPIDEALPCSFPAIGLSKKAAPLDVRFVPSFKDHRRVQSFFLSIKWGCCRHGVDLEAAAAGRSAKQSSQTNVLWNDGTPSGLLAIQVDRHLRESGRNLAT